MHRHDLDAIAALADGTLENEAGARALIATCDECHAEYQSQRAVLAALSATGQVAMTETERAALHRDLWTALRSRQARRPAKPWWYRVSYAAASLLVVIGVAAVISQTDSKDAAETFAALSADEAADVMEESTARSAAPAPTSAAAANDSASVAAAPEAAFDFAAIAKSVRSDATTLSQYSREDGTTAGSVEMSECVIQAEVEGQRIVTAIENYILLLPDGVEIGPDTPITFVDTTTCTVVHVEE